MLSSRPDVAGLERLDRALERGDELVEGLPRELLVGQDRELGLVDHRSSSSVPSVRVRSTRVSTVPRATMTCSASPAVHARRRRAGSGRRRCARRRSRARAWRPARACASASRAAVEQQAPTLEAVAQGSRRHGRAGRPRAAEPPRCRAPAGQRAAPRRRGICAARRRGPAARRPPGRGAGDDGGSCVPSGVASSAAALGVGARRSAAKSASVTSDSWPTPTMIGTGASATARTTRSSLKPHRSSSEPPPRARMIVSRSRWA